MILNNIRFASSLIQKNLNKKAFSTKLDSDVKNYVVKKSNKKFKNVLLITTIPFASYYLYYQFLLNEQEKRKVRVNLKSIFRAVRSFKVGLYIATDYKWNLYGLNEDSQEYSSAIKGCHIRSAQRMVDACIANGGLYVKLGQGLSTMNQVLPEEFYLTLRKLQNEALRSEGTDIDELFLEEFGKKPLEVFQEFDYKPLAAASLAQVHKARDNEGKECAVKLQYIDLQDRFNGDIFTCRCILKLIAWSFPSFSFSWILEELRGTLEKELDFLNEGANGERCYNELKHLKYVYVPKIYWDKSSKRILTMEFINGVKISDIDGIKKLGLNLKDIDIKLVNAFAEQVFHSGFVHADPHHANVYVRKRENSNDAEIVLLDHGLYEYIPPEDRKNLCKLWKSIILKDEEQMKYYSKKLNVKEENFLAFAAFLMMRPLHRPIHDKFIFSDKWNNMTENEKLEAVKAGKIKVPRTRQDFQNMKQSELHELSQKAKPYIQEIKESILSLLRQMPKSLLLICRNLNTIRAVIHDHGNIIDRHTIMARSAIAGAYKDQLKISFSQRLRVWFELKYFDLLLVYDRFKRFIGSVYLNYYLKNNQLSKSIYNELNKSMENI